MQQNKNAISDFWSWDGDPAVGDLSEVHLKTQMESRKTAKQQNSKSATTKTVKQMVADSPCSWRRIIGRVNKLSIEAAISAIYQQYIGLLSKSSWWQRDQIRAGSCWGWWGSGRRGCRGRRACSRWAPCLSPVGADPNFVQQSILTPFHNSLYTDV